MALGSSEEAASASAADAGALVGRCLERMMRATAVPTNLGAIGYALADTTALVSGTIVQRRLLDNAPRPIDEVDLDGVFRDAVGTPDASAGRAS